MIIEFCVISRFIAMTHICITLFKFLVFVAPFCVNGIYYKNGTARVLYPIIMPAAARGKLVLTVPLFSRKQSRYKNALTFI